MGDNLREHPIAMAAMPLFLLVMALVGVPEMVATVSQKVPSLAPLLVVAMAFAVQGMIIAACLQGLILTSPKA